MKARWKELGRLGRQGSEANIERLEKAGLWDGSPIKAAVKILQTMPRSSQWRAVGMLEEMAQNASEKE